MDEETELIQSARIPHNSGVELNAPKRLKISQDIPDYDSLPKEEQQMYRLYFKQKLYDIADRFPRSCYTSECDFDGSLAYLHRYTACVEREIERQLRQEQMDKRIQTAATVLAYSLVLLDEFLNSRKES